MDVHTYSIFLKAKCTLSYITAWSTVTQNQFTFIFSICSIMMNGNLYSKPISSINKHLNGTYVEGNWRTWSKPMQTKTV